MHKNAKIYIAGHRGLVGSALVRRLKSDGFNNLVLRTSAELDLRDQAAAADFFQSQKPEFVFLAAARVGGILANNNYPAEFIYDNLMIQSNVIHHSHLAGVKRLLFMGSSCIYPKFCPQPMKEQYLLTGELEPTNEPYAIAKITGIKMCQAYNRQYNTRFLSVMPTNLYGPNDNFDLQTSHVLPALIRKFHLAKLASEKNWQGILEDQDIFGPIPDDIKLDLGVDPLTCKPLDGSRFEPTVTLWGSGRPRREFLHVDDLAEASVFLMTLEPQRFDELIYDPPAPVINVGCGKDLSIRELATLTSKIIGEGGSIKWDASKPDGTPQKLLNVFRLNQSGWYPSVTLADGIERVYKWYKSNSIRCSAAKAETESATSYVR
jgi:GDP-L-fucose synthase